MKRLYYKIKQILILAINLMILMPLVSSIANEQNVTVSITPKPKVDICLAKGLSSTDVTNFSQDMLNGLKEQNIDTSDVNISSVESTFISTNDADASTIFNSWEQFPVAADVNNWSWYQANWKLDAASGTIYTTSDVNCTGFWDSSKIDASDYTIEFDALSEDTHWGDPYEYMFRMDRRTDNRNNYSFYMVSFVGGGTTGETPQIALSKITSWIPSTNDSGHCGPGCTSGGVTWAGTTATGTTLKCINNPGITIVGAWVHCKIEAYGNNIKVYVNNQLLIDYTDTDNPFLNGGYGPATVSNPSTKFKNISIQTQNAKKLEEVLREPTWRDGSLRFLVNVTDKLDLGLSDGTSTYGELATRLMNDGIYFVNWGNDINKDQFTNLIISNDNKGKFINNTEYINSITETSKYIRSVLELYQDSEYVIVNEPVNINVNPESARNNTIDSTWPYGKWKIIHDYEYFENNMGQFADSGKYVDDFITTFDKTGRYEFTYRDLPITPKYVYVHRRPVASFTMKLNNGKVELSSNSYDLDLQSKNNGISEEEWSYKTSDKLNGIQES